MFYLQIETFPTGEIVPRIQIAYIGNSVSFFCSSISEVSWFKERSKLSTKRKNVDMTELTLTIHLVTSGDSGKYVCQGTHENGSLFRVASTLHVGGK